MRLYFVNGRAKVIGKRLLGGSKIFLVQVIFEVYEVYIVALWSKRDDVNNMWGN